MTPQGTRRLRTAMAALVLLVGVAVFWSLRRREPAAASPPPATSGEAQAPQFQGVEQRAFHEGRQRFVLEAARWVGKKDEQIRLETVKMTFPFVGRGSPGTATVTSRECSYTPSQQKAVFEKDVVLRTDDGFELRTDELVYRGDRSLARSDEPVQLARKDLSGTARSMVYRADRGDVTLSGDVVLETHDPDVPPVEVRAAQARISRSDGSLRLSGGVQVTRGEDVITASWLRADFDSEYRVYRAKFGGDVDLRTGGAGVLPGAAGLPGGPGPRHLTARQLDLWFRDDRSLREATAGRDAVLELLPGGSGPRQRRRLEGDTLIFGFAPGGTLTRVQGLAGSSFEVTELPPAPPAPRRVTCRRFLAHLDPVSGELQTVDFQRDVAFAGDGRRATAGRGHYDGVSDRLVLRGSPILFDDGEKSELHADDIYVRARTGDVAARGHVQHILRGGGGFGLSGGSAGPTLVSCGKFDYDDRARKASYQEEVVLRSGKDEVRADALDAIEATPGERTLSAKGHVVSRLNPRGETGNAAAPFEVQAAEMLYDEAKGEIRYSGDVTIRQGEVSTHSPKAVVSLSADGRKLNKLVAGEPVEVHQGTRVATGRQGTYTPEDGTMVLVGEKAVLKDDTQEVSGRTLTFRVGDERILVDGQEEIRTQMLIKNQPPVH